LRRTIIMKNAWNESEANHFVNLFGPEWGTGIALLTYATRLVGSAPALAMHGAGNTSIKGIIKAPSGNDSAALFVKASGVAMDRITPSDFVCLDHTGVGKLRAVSSLTDEALTREIRTHMLKPYEALPSVETPMHAFIDRAAVMHTHPTAILALTNRTDGDKIVAEALGKDIGVLPYASSGLALGRAVADELDRGKGLQGAVVMHHGLVTWGENQKQAYDRTIEIVSRAEEYIRESRRQVLPLNHKKTPLETARQRYTRIAPFLRELLSPSLGDPVRPRESMVLSALITRETLDIIDAPAAKALICTAPLSPDCLGRIRAYPLLIEAPDYDDMNLLHAQLKDGLESFIARYDAYVKRHSPHFPKILLLPGLGAVCAGRGLDMAQAARDIMEQALLVKRLIYETGGTYLGLTEDCLFEAEFRSYRKAKN
jgi:rhamnose utilization protein RhaD (predicted bifunctional aldolase and dehydrogenase)